MDKFPFPSRSFSDWKVAFFRFLPGFYGSHNQGLLPRWLNNQFCTAGVQSQEVAGESESSKKIPPQSSPLYLAAR